MKKKEVKFVDRSYNNFGRIQLKVDKEGNLITYGGATPTFQSKAGQEVCLVTVEDYKKLLAKLWEQQFLMQCA